MTKYKLGVFKKGEGRIIDLDKVIKIKELEKLDEFTKSFNSEEELKLYLCKQELITKDELNYKIRVAYDKDDKIRKIPVIYKPMEKHMDRMKLRQILVILSEPYDIYNKEQVGESITFLERLVNHYYMEDNSKSYVSLNINNIKYYINTIKRGGDILYNINILKTAIDELYKKIVYKRVNKNEVIVNYKGFRDLAVFIYKYEKKCKEQKQQVEQERENMSWNQLNLFDYQKSLKKTDE